jgi:hypothetical protein
MEKPMKRAELPASAQDNHETDPTVSSPFLLDISAATTNEGERLIDTLRAEISQEANRECTHVDSRVYIFPGDRIDMLDEGAYDAPLTLKVQSIMRELLAEKGINKIDIEIRSIKDRKGNFQPMLFFVGYNNSTTPEEFSAALTTTVNRLVYTTNVRLEESDPPFNQIILPTPTVNFDN